MKDPGPHIAQTLKQRRADLGWSLDRTARETGVSKAMLGQIERGESSPTVATLWKIATGSGLPLSAFLERPLPRLDRTIKRVAEDLRQPADESGLAAATLFPFEPQFGFEQFDIVFEPGCNRISDPHDTGVVEHITVIEGALEILADGSWHRLQSGQSLRFAADREHGYRNLTDQPARILNLIHYPG